MKANIQLLNHIVKACTKICESKHCIHKEQYHSRLLIFLICSAFPDFLSSVTAPHENSAIHTGSSLL